MLFSEKKSKREERRRRPNYHAPNLEAHQHNSLLWHPAFWEPDQLYDLHVDPKEVINLAYEPEYADILVDMKSRLKRWLTTFGNHPFGEFI